MQIIIVGCGKVGLFLTQQLVEEGHNVTVIDIDPEKVRRAALTYDVMGIAGNGASYNILKEADIAHADILIAVTLSDEVNLLCCVIAKKANCRTIARVRNPIYSEEMDIIKKEMDVSLIINPERLAARKIRRLVQYNSSLGVDGFANGRVELVTFKVPQSSSIIGQALKEAGLQKEGMLICIAHRDDETFIPDGNFAAKEGDILSVIVAADKIKPGLERIGLTAGKVKNTTIVGGGDLSFYLAKMLNNIGLRVKLIENDRKKCERLSEALDGVEIICGNGISKDVYDEEHLDKEDVIVAATGVDEENIIFSLYAKANSNAKVITKVSHVDYNSVMNALELEHQINPLYTAGELILKFVRGLSGSIDSAEVKSLYRLRNGAAEAIEFRLTNASDLLGVPLMDLHIRKNTIIAAIVRNDKLLIPGGSDSFMAGDSVIIITTNRGYRDINDIIER